MTHSIHLITPFYDFIRPKIKNVKEKRVTMYLWEHEVFLLVWN